MRFWRMNTSGQGGTRTPKVERQLGYNQPRYRLRSTRPYARQRWRAVPWVGLEPTTNRV